jgi:hypothetical protein
MIPCAVSYDLIRYEAEENLQIAKEERTGENNGNN